jgi:hypothetical protein
MQIPQQELRLLVESFPNCSRSFGIVPEEMLREAENHLTARLLFFPRSLAASLCNEAMNSS